MQSVAHALGDGGKFPFTKGTGYMYPGVQGTGYRVRGTGYLAMTQPTPAATCRPYHIVSLPLCDNCAMCGLRMCDSVFVCGGWWVGWLERGGREY